MRVRRPRLAPLFALAALSFAGAQADDRVRFVGNANPAYTARKFVDGKPRRETYVFAVGQRFNGATADRTFDHTTIREIAGVLAPSLTKQNYWPTKELADADLLLVVHWGVTIPQASIYETTARTTYESGVQTSGMLDDSPAALDLGALIGPLDYIASENRWQQFNQIADRNARDISDASTAGLLGYSATLARYSRSIDRSAEQYTLLSDLRGERYFVIVRAYDLKATTKMDRSRAVWTLHLNISSPGNNFTGALGLMSEAAAPHFGRATGNVGTARPKIREGRIDYGDMIILGEAKPAANNGHSGSQ